MTSSALVFPGGNLDGEKVSDSSDLAKRKEKLVFWPARVRFTASKSYREEENKEAAAEEEQVCVCVCALARKEGIKKIHLLKEKF